MDLDLTSAAVASLALGALSLSLVVGFQLCAWLQLRRARAAGEALPPVSVLKPIKGVDAGLRENLEAFAAQDYPSWELLIAIAERDDPAHAVARDLQRAHPDKRIRIISGAPDIGLNPKVCNLAHASKRARHDLWLISDADVRPSPAYLRDMVAPLAEGARLVHSVLIPGGERSLGSAMDNAHLCAWIAPSVCAGDRVLSHPCVVGKSILLGADDLRRIGGWARYCDVLAEDYLLGRDFHAAGMRVALCHRPVAVHTERRSVASFFARHVRWSQMRRQMRPPLFALELLLYPVAFFAIGVALALAAGATSLAIAACAGIATKVALDVVVVQRIRGASLPLWAWPLIAVKDVLLVAAWCAAWIDTSVEWRGRRMRIGPGTQLVPCSDGGMFHGARRAWRLAQRMLF